MDNVVTGKVDLVTRLEWGAVDHTGNKPIRHPVRYVFLTINSRSPRCSSREECSQVLRDMQRSHLDQGCSDIKYNFLIADDGTVYEGRGWEFRPHPPDLYSEMEGKIMDFACIGDFGSDLRPDAMYDAQWNLLKMGADLKFLSDDACFW